MRPAGQAPSLRANGFSTRRPDRTAEVQFQFLQMLIKQIHIGIITIENSEDIVLINPTAETLHNMKGVRNWRLVEQLNPDFYNEVKNLQGNGRKIITLLYNNQSKMLSLDVRTLLILERPIVLITFQDINNELEQKEFDARIINLFLEIETSLLKYLSQSSAPDKVLDNFVRIVKSTSFHSIWYSEFVNQKFFKMFPNQ